MQPDTPRIGLKKMNSDGSDLVDLANQYHASFDDIDADFTVHTVAGGGAHPPVSMNGTLLNATSTDSYLHSTGVNTWSTTFSRSSNFHTQYTAPNPIPNGFTFLPVSTVGIFTATKNFTRVDDTTIQMNGFGYYLFQGALRFNAGGGGANNSGLFQLRIGINGTFPQSFYGTRLRGTENTPASVHVTALYRYWTGSATVRLEIFNNAVNGQVPINSSVGQGWYNNFMGTFLRPLATSEF